MGSYEKNKRLAGEIPPVIVVCSYQSKQALKPLRTKIYRKCRGITLEYVRLARSLENDNVFQERSILGLILVHSIHHGRFIISDDQEAHYHSFMERAREKVGAKQVVLVVNDFASSYTKEHFRIESECFRKDQPTASDVTKEVILCSKLSKLPKDQLEKVYHYVNGCWSMRNPERVRESEEESDVRVIEKNEQRHGCFSFLSKSHGRWRRPKLPWHRRRRL